MAGLTDRVATPRAQWGLMLRLHFLLLKRQATASPGRKFVMAVLVILGMSTSSGGPGGNFGRMPAGWEVWLLILFVPATLTSIARYVSFRLRYDAHELVIKTGLIFRNERHIPYSRVQNVDAVQNAVHRLLNVVEVRLETGGGQFAAGHPFAAVRAMPDDRPLPELYLLGSSDYGANLAAELGLGFAFAGHFSQEPPEVPMLSYRAAFTPRGPRAEPHAILALSVFCADSDEAAQRMASSMRLSFVQLRSGRPGRLPSPEAAMAHAFSPEEQAVVDFYRTLQIVGTPARVRARIEDAAARTQADEIMIVTHAFDPEARVRSYELVAQAFGLAGAA